MLPYSPFFLGWCTSSSTIVPAKEKEEAVTASTSHTSGFTNVRNWPFQGKIAQLSGPELRPPVLFLPRCYSCWCHVRFDLLETCEIWLIRLLLNFFSPVIQWREEIVSA